MRKSCLLLLAVCSSLVILHVQAHSWIACTDYRGTITDNNYNAALCQGNFRGWTRFGGGSSAFGTQDSDCAHCRPRTSSTSFADPGDTAYTAMKTCMYNKGESANYDTTYKISTYSPGQTIKLVWPSKNHGGPTNPRGACTGDDSDFLDTLHIACDLGASTDPSLASMLGGSYLAVDMRKTSQTQTWGATTSTGKGFQNCPNQCGNTDKAVCFSDVTLPTTLPVGSTCSFYWIWELNQGEFYTSCWEAQITSASGSSPVASPVASPVSSPTSKPVATSPIASPTSKPVAATTKKPTVAPTSKNRPTTKAPGSGSSSGSCSNSAYSQCGGKGYSGTTCCPSGHTCVYDNDWWSMCAPSGYSASESSDSALSTSSVTPYILAGGAGVLLCAGVAIVIVRRRRRIAQVDQTVLLGEMQ